MASYARRAFRAIRLYRDTEIAEWARLAYRDMVEWFGEPLNADWETVAHYGPATGTKQIASNRQYLVVVNVDYAGTDGAYAIVAELVCRRVILDKPGIVQARWIRQIVETCACWRSTERRGRRDPALDRIGEGRDDALPRVTLPMMKGWRGNAPGRTRGIDQTTADAIVLELRRLAYSLQEAVGWEGVRSLVFAQTWEEWLGGLAPPARLRAVRLLGLEDRWTRWARRWWPGRADGGAA